MPSMKRLSIAYITVNDPRDKHAWSGTNYYLMQSIQKYIGDVNALGPITAEPARTLFSILNYLGLKIFHKRFNYRDSQAISKIYEKKITQLIQSKKFDLIVAPAGTALLSQLTTKVPIVYINDRCIPGAIEYHDILKNLFDWSKKGSIQTEKRAIANSSLTIYSSSWAADAAKENFAEYANKIQVIPFGANFDETPSFHGAKTLQTETIKLLFVGVKWIEKGGNIALQALKELHAKNIKAELIICGCVPPDEVSKTAGVKIEGFLSKKNPQEFDRLQSHFYTSHFLILPTRHEAYGLVFCEAAAYGLPVLATDTGGIPEIVVHGETGFLFNENETGESYAAKIEELINNPMLYSQISHNARKRYEEKLNWNAFGERLQKLVQSIL